MQNRLKIVAALCLPMAWTLISCADTGRMKRSYLLESEYASDDFVTKIYEYRTWRPPEELDFDPIEIG